MAKSLWILRPVDTNSAPWRFQYDKAFGFVIRADSEERARALLTHMETGDEVVGQRDAWTNPAFSTCVELTQEGDEEIIMRDFLSG
jgi:hypothetical protein